jgi:hypothetical protein
MESATFRKWLVEQGCRFDHGHEQRHEGHVMVTVHRGGRKAEVPLGGSHQFLDTRVGVGLVSGVPAGWPLFCGISCDWTSSGLLK